MSQGWIGVDLDGTLAEYHGWQGEDHIGEPIQSMIDRVLAWRAQGRLVKIFTARLCGQTELGKAALRAWMILHLGEELPVTNVKDYQMVELWDDRAVAVEANTGQAFRWPGGMVSP